MPLYFIETIVEGSRHPDRIGTTFLEAEGAMQAALWAIVDIVHDEAEVRTDMDLAVIVKNSAGEPIFSATLQAARRPQPKVRAPMPILAEAPATEFLLTT